MLKNTEIKKAIEIWERPQPNKVINKTIVLVSVNTDIFKILIPKIRNKIAVHV